MNIKINKEQFDTLMGYNMVKILMGSRMYGTHREDSDYDYLCVFEPPEDWGTAGQMYPNITQFQYDDEENNTDYIFTSVNQFWKNQKSGDSTINSDIVMFSDQPMGGEKERLNLCRQYNVIKSFLGFAKRDLKQGGDKKIKHAARGLYCAECLLDGRLPDLGYIRLMAKMNPKTYYVNQGLEEEKELRAKLNDMFNKDEIKRYHIHETDDELLNILLHSNNIKEFKY